jgi:hypothetical protein
MFLAILSANETVIALTQLPGVVVTAFERAAAPREAGAWISLNPSGLNILNRLVDAQEIRDIVYRPEDNTGA